MEKVLINYTDNTKQGVRKKKVQNTINRIDHMIYDIHQKAEELQYRVQDLEEYIDYMEDIKDQLEKNVKSDDKLNNLYQSLKEINAKLWVIEDDKRQCEKDKNFGEKFINLSRDVHFLNDDRAKIKLEINNHTGSSIKEIKEYTSY